MRDSPSLICIIIKLRTVTEEKNMRLQSRAFSFAKLAYAGSPKST